MQPLSAACSLWALALPRHSTTPSSNGGWSLKKIFDGVKDGKDLAEILVLAPDFAEKWVKLQLAYETLKQTYGW